MTAPWHVPLIRDLGALPHERRPRHGEPEDQYFRRLAAEFRRHERGERRRRMLAWLLHSVPADTSPDDVAQPARSGRALG